MPDTILIIDDDIDTLAMAELNLSGAGYTVVTASNGFQGLQRFHERQPDLVLLDIMMPGMDGWQACAGIRSVSNVPIIFLTALDSERDVVQGLGMGGDDYIIKPFKLTVLRARVKAALRRARMPATLKGAVVIGGQGDLQIDVDMHAVTVRGQTVHLTNTEYRLLLYLAERPGRPVTVQQIYEAVWESDAEAMLSSVKWYVWRLRQKIEPDPRQPRFILTEPGVGYRFMLD